ncbi:hypothetical protein BU24DRAFT_185105 [Aaosphaeria arxii CBS 175.79]|uniref:Uncharacterized protein n=1 Tax=Aaosphaeria arxii CBS 175.79 TaxID=1450172 RepID=A0A6A5XSA0_9PLEO|nr:uncharacterized protein BU24DRAFT_185105 [Aaosphaeria arxii CBS 175.79]KAF2015776.1 hypothetical protein BU24DRAFT_185105 [Aaosphaeria arxii CBS 175.79]
MVIPRKRDSGGGWVLCYHSVLVPHTSDLGRSANLWRSWGRCFYGVGSTPAGKAVRVVGKSASGGNKTTIPRIMVSSKTRPGNGRDRVFMSAHLEQTRSCVKQRARNQRLRFVRFYDAWALRRRENTLITVTSKCNLRGLIAFNSLVKKGMASHQGLGR